MADFKTHISVSTGLGIAYGAFGYLQFELPLGTCIIAGGLCSVSGMLPDLDSDSGIPIRETKAFTSAVIPMLLMERFQRMGMSHASMVLAGGLIYFLLRFVVWNLFKRYTKHRGMWHSVPAALIAAMLAFLICSSQDISIRMFRSWAVFLGFMSHLAMDELYSVDLNGRVLKRSFGTAMKFWGNSNFSNITTYAKLLLLSLIAVNDPMIQEAIDDNQIQIPAYAQKAIQALQLKAVKNWLPHNHRTHEDFDGKSLLPIRRIGPTTQRRRRLNGQPTVLAEWLNYFTGSKSSNVAPASFNQTQEAGASLIGAADPQHPASAMLENSPSASPLQRSSLPDNTQLPNGLNSNPAASNNPFLPRTPGNF